jgi:hypothetical protein
MRLVFLDSGPLGLLAKPQGKSKLGMTMASWNGIANGLRFTVGRTGHVQSFSLRRNKNKG